MCQPYQFNVVHEKKTYINNINDLVILDVRDDASWRKFNLLSGVAKISYSLHSTIQIQRLIFSQYLLLILFLGPLANTFSHVLNFWFGILRKSK